MTVAMLLAACALAALLVTSAMAKARDVSAFGTAARELGVPRALVPIAAAAIPAIELLLAVGLLVDPTRRWAAAAAVALLVGFACALARVVHAGRMVHCQCFGSLVSGTVTSRTVGRNVLIAAVALGPALASTSWSSAAAAAGGYTTLALTLAVGVLATAIALVVRWQFALLDRYGNLLVRLDAIEEGRRPAAAAAPTLEAGSPAPTAMLQTLDDEPFPLEDLWRDRTALIVFSSPNCSACRMLLPDLGALASAEPGLRVAVLSPVPARRSAREVTGPVTWLTDRGQSIFDAYRASRTPTAVIVGPDGSVRASAGGVAAIRDLFRRADVSAAGWAERTLRDRSGREMPVAEALAGDGALLFWNPDCPYCDQIQADLDELGSRAVTVVVAGPPRADLEEVAGWPVWFDEGGTCRAAGLRGTPAAVAVRDGAVIGEPALGGGDVLALLRDVGTQANAGLGAAK
jgi:thiol-disulfide isomerase/thioredoxin